MTELTVNIRIHFINKHQGGWRDLPQDIEQYACTIKFLDVDDSRAWTFIIQIDTYNFQTGKMVGSARFLAKKIPEYLIVQNRRFELFEGTRFVGHGVMDKIVQNGFD